MGCQFIFSSLFALIEPLNSILLLSPWIALGADKWGWTLHKEIQERSYLCRGAISAVWKQCFTLLQGDLEFVITINWHTEQWVIHFRKKGETAEFNSIAVRAGWACKVFFSLISLCLTKGIPAALRQERCPARTILYTLFFFSSWENNCYIQI